jgi:hypothetical protein
MVLVVSEHWKLGIFGNRKSFCAQKSVHLKSGNSGMMRGWNFQSTAVE